jgi:small subunit ribosomal protein S3e
MGLIMRRGGAKGCEIIISGKVRGQRAKSQKYKAGYIVSTGQPKLEFIDEAVRHVELRQGVLGVKVKIMMDSERQTGKYRKVMPDFVKIHEPKDESYDIKPDTIAAQQN